MIKIIKNRIILKTQRNTQQKENKIFISFNIVFLRNCFLQLKLAKIIKRLKLSFKNLQFYTL